MTAERDKTNTEYTGDGREIPIEQHSLSEQVTNFLYSELIHGRLRQGDRINELLLAKNLGISRNPIREGIKRLEDRGFLVSVPHKGTFVRRFSVGDVNDIFDFRKNVEVFALTRALPRMTNADLAGMKQAVDKMLAAVERDDGEALVNSDLDFHFQLMELGGNQRSIRAFRDLFSEIRMLVAFVDHTFESLHDAAADHIPVVEAFESRDLERSITALEAHIDDAHQRLLGTYKEENNPDRARR